MIRQLSIALGDVDGDNDLDVFLGLSLEGLDEAGFLWLNNGQGGFIEAGATSVEEFEAVLGDIDGDGDLDAIVTSIDRSADDEPLRAHYELWLNDAQGGFDEKVQILTSSRTRGPVFHLPRPDLGDVDGDRDIDVLIDGRLLLTNGPPSLFAPGDANRDFQFDQQDIVQVLQSAKYLTGEPASFEDGDWNNDGVFDQMDVVAALQTGNYLRGPYMAGLASDNFGQLRTTPDGVVMCGSDSHKKAPR